MRKLRSDSIWNELSPEQQTQAEQWLFEEGMSYDDTTAKVKSEFGVTTSVAGVGRFYRRLARERQADDLLETQAWAGELAGAKVRTDVMRSAALKLIAQRTLTVAVEQPGEIRQLESLAKILLADENNEIRRARLKLRQDQFRYETAAAANEDLPDLARMLSKINEDPALDEKGRLDAVESLLYPEPAGASPSVGRDSVEP